MRSMRIAAAGLLATLLIVPWTARAATDDRDADGLLDAWEVVVGLRADTLDTDGDGYGDGEELRAGYNPSDALPNAMPEALRVRDSDGDGSADLDELRWGTDPLAPDTDGDGYRDGEELRAGYDPRDIRPKQLERRIIVDRGAQLLTMRLGAYVIAEHPVSTGRAGSPTPRGMFRIASKTPRAWSSAARLWMPWWMNFTGTRAPPGLYGIHELPEWPGGKKEGEAHLGMPVSGGCIRLGVGPAEHLYTWAPVGTVVEVR